ncbi:MAG: PspC domain-containing protein [bacterium]|nr:PspC domain-containing protein [bacterium]
MKKLYRSQNNKVFAGIIGGLGEYFDLDPVILRVAWLLLTIFTGFFPGTIVYIASVFVVPQKHSN